MDAVIPCPNDDKIVTNTHAFNRGTSITIRDNKIVSWTANYLGKQEDLYLSYTVLSALLASLMTML